MITLNTSTLFVLPMSVFDLYNDVTTLCILLSLLIVLLVPSSPMLFIDQPHGIVVFIVCLREEARLIHVEQTNGSRLVCWD